jgi:hypothetical protein
LAAVAPDWLRGVAPNWYERYDRRIEDSRLPHTEAERDAYARTVGEDGFALLDRLAGSGTPETLRTLPKVRVLGQVWEQQFERDASPPGDGPGGQVLLKPAGQLPPAAEGIESPYDPEARYRSKRGMGWTGYAAHLTETCDEDFPNLITHVATTTAAVHEVNCTAAVQRALVERGLPPEQHLVDAGYVSAVLLVGSREDHGIQLVGPPRGDASWQNRTEGGYTIEHFTIDWDRKEVLCPEGRVSVAWKEYPEAERGAYISVWFNTSDCRSCPVRALCTRSTKQGRNLKLPARPLYEALQEMRSFIASEEGRRVYAWRAGIEGTISQGVRSFGLRRTRYRGTAKTHLQHVATAVAINFDRIAAWLEGRPRAATRTSRFAGLVA